MYISTDDAVYLEFCWESIDHHLTDIFRLKSHKF